MPTSKRSNFSAIAMAAAISLFLFFLPSPNTLSQTLSHTEYHCFIGNYTHPQSPTKVCEGDGSVYTATKYTANISTKSVLINEISQTLWVRKTRLYLVKEENQIWGDCDIIDGKNFICRKAVSINDGYFGSRVGEGIYEVIQGNVKRCTYCARYKPISFFEYWFNQTAIRLSSSECFQTGDQKPSCR